MKTQALILICLLFNSCIEINRIEGRNNDDGTKELSIEEEKFVTSFDLNKYNTQSIPNSFQYISGKDLASIAKRNKYTVVFIWASWCSKCHVVLPHLRSWKDSFSKNNNGVDLVLIQQNIKINYTQKVLKDANYPYLSYFIDSRKYSSNELVKQDRFLADIIPSMVKTNGGVPTTIILDSEAKLVAEIPGYKINFKQLLSKMQL